MLLISEPSLHTLFSMCFYFKAWFEMVLQSREGKEAESKPGMLRGGRGLGLSVGWWQRLGEQGKKSQGCHSPGNSNGKAAGTGMFGRVLGTGDSTKGEVEDTLSPSSSFILNQFPLGAHSSTVILPCQVLSRSPFRA